MYKGWKDILLALLLGFVLPSIIVVYISKAGNDIKKLPGPTEGNQNEYLEESRIMIPVLLDDGTVADLELNDYLTSVLLREMPADFEMEALKAQAVVARTYTLRRLKYSAKHDTAVVCTDSGCCQGYYSQKAYLQDGGSMESVQKMSSAVLETSDEVLVYNNQLIEATYFSCSGGMTEDAVAVWGSDIPYLVATESPGEENAAHYTDTLTLSITEFAQKLDIKIPEKHVQLVEAVSYTSGGGVDEIRICGRAYRGTQLRQLLGLRSTAFVISVVGDTVTITTKGFGHRVGMSQYGADAMAVGGNTYRQILSHYYRGTELISFTEIDNDI